eukprot:TRINITY_DN4007_c0_g2_i1.p1 TRINITY_DN4007_c0_g2~~TRINITY_DN4007_c0_g2_i1.p1  ORF type:complete len:839 (-),score=238.76 TRINITY_DN4007_c0_g2_i1:32-2548(-)
MNECPNCGEEIKNQICKNCHTNDRKMSLFKKKKTPPVERKGSMIEKRTIDKEIKFQQESKNKSDKKLLKEKYNKNQISKSNIFNKDDNNTDDKNDFRKISFNDAYTSDESTSNKTSMKLNRKSETNIHTIEKQGEKDSDIIISPFDLEIILLKQKNQTENNNNIPTEESSIPKSPKKQNHKIDPNRKRDSTALGLNESFFPAVAEFPNKFVDDFIIPIRYTVDQVKTFLWKNTPKLEDYSILDYYIGSSKRNKFTVEFMKFDKVYPKFHKLLQKGETVKIYFYKKTSGPLKLWNKNKEKIEIQELEKVARNKALIQKGIKEEPRPIIRHHDLVNAPEKGKIRTMTKHFEEEIKKESPLLELQEKSTMDLGMSEESVTIIPESVTVENGENTDLTSILNMGSSSSLDGLEKLLLRRNGESDEKNSGEDENNSGEENQGVEFISSNNHNDSFDPVLRESKIQMKMIRRQTLTVYQDDTLILCTEGFELDKKHSFKKWKDCCDLENMLLFRPELNKMIYSAGFAQSAHTNYYGVDKNVGEFILSVALKPQEEGFVFLLWTGPKNCEKLMIPKSQMSRMLGTRNKIKYIKKHLEMHNNFKPETKILQSNEPLSFAQELIKFEASQIVTSYKIGVLYAKDGQILEEDMFCNNEEYPKFDKFLSILGDKVALNGWTRYRGGLDTKNNHTGTHSIFTTFKPLGSEIQFEIMFHVSTMLPFFPLDKQQLERKRHLGNDIVVLVFVDGNTPFSTDTIASEFNHVYIVIQPIEGEEMYKINICKKSGVPDFGPKLPNPCIFPNDENLRNFLLTKIINAERSAYFHPVFFNKIKRTRQRLINALISKQK